MIFFKTEDNPEAQPGETGVIVPIRIESKKALFDFLKDALRLPSYFGHNWDALEECLHDPSVLGATKTVLIHHDLPFENEPAERHIYLQVVCEAAENSSLFDVVFPEHFREQVTTALGRHD